MVDVLLLNADFSPIGVISFERAVCLLLEEKVLLVQQYAGRLLRSPTLTLPWPAVVALKRYVEVLHGVRFNRANVLARDAYTCQYCGVRPRTRSGNPILEQLSLDHVVPRAQSTDGVVRLPWSGERAPVTCWQNIVAACHDCNHRKAARTPGQAGMKLLSLPRAPTPWDAMRIALTRVQIPPEWRDYVPEPWKGYWEDELDD